MARVVCITSAIAKSSVGPQPAPTPVVKGLRGSKASTLAPPRSLGLSLGWGNLPSPQQFTLGKLLDTSPVGKVTLTELLTMVDQLTQERSKTAQLSKDNAALKSRVSSLQSSLVQAENANAASADTILRLQAEVASASHLDRLARGSEFLSARKEVASLSVSIVVPNPCSTFGLVSSPCSGFGLIGIQCCPALQVCALPKQVRHFTSERVPGK
eukprot:jgi/Botrbrau1/22710/Bobra.0132s0049.1